MELERKIKTLLEDHRFKELFFCEASMVFTEKEVVDRFGESRRIDRLILKDDAAIIIDFKSRIEEEGQASHPAVGGALAAATKQIEEYIELIKAIYPDKKVRGFLLYIDELMIKEVK